MSGEKNYDENPQQEQQLGEQPHNFHLSMRKASDSTIEMADYHKEQLH